MKPIPKSWLIHTACAVELKEREGWEEPSERKRTELSRIRVEPSSNLRISKSNIQVQLSAVLFYDCRNSRPRDFDFSRADKVEYDGEQYDIVSVQKHYDDRKLHHMEVELCL
ncbi:MAG: minor capsid protein [Bacteroides sp.]|nr:minor capsid protein [Bacteroides sp.]